MKLPITETIMTFVCVCILCGLGTWQLNRLEWKDDIVAGLRAAYDAPDSSLSGGYLDTLSAQDKPLVYGTITARLMGDRAVFLGPKTQDGDIGFHLLIPGKLTNNQTLFINAGFVAQEGAQQLLSVLPKSDIKITGLVRKPDWSSFTSKNSPQNDLWFRADVEEIARHKNISNAYPFILYADSFSVPITGVTPHEKGWLPRNKHAQYATFWFSMALVLLVIYGFYLQGGRKKTPR